MGFASFYERNSKKISRTIIVVLCTIITGMILCVPLFRDLTDNQMKVLMNTKMGWFPIYIIIVRWFRDREDKEDIK